MAAIDMCLSHLQVSNSPIRLLLVSPDINGRFNSEYGAHSSTKVASSLDNCGVA